MANKNYEEGKVIQSLSKKHDLNVAGRMIQELNGNRAKGDVGIKSRGKIDFLKKKGYVHVWVDEFKF